ncbi:type III-B CRISPR module RAMP protein Cmr4 [Halothermothrix orenii]|uniref:CRISPR-associated RAMP protein, Cmr4 family n=1 Tax=Halothermothrix orenii (strain H 168 / OCM 544 / DSM 9562) TaxID=373903 RepID=B8CY94_HALOH|nr:type III-B CRISPR module RAMP protein Cmr4 [Halothermothrix orenii]ACL70263.1 CRISPR-associated RAMP protein, Cmr4 family [Halothermothrix orenii H 168]
MYKETAILGLYCETSVHAGSGSDLGVIDLPIQREKYTDYPVFQASTLKGALRASFDTEIAIVNSLMKGVFKSFSFKNAKEGEEELEKAINLVFGDESNKSASALAFTDARILLFPVKSARNVFAWITSPMVLNRLKRDLEVAGINVDWEAPEIKKDAIISEKSSLDIDGNIILEEYTYSVNKQNIEGITNWIRDNIFAEDYTFWRDKLESDLVIIDDDEFKDFVSMSTELVPRIKIKNETKVVDKDGGALWYEENLPPETVLYSLVLATDILREEKDLENEDLKKAENVIQFFEEGLKERIQLGGNETIGRGIIRTRLVRSGKNG